MKKTEWFPGSVKPARPGRYEVGHSEYLSARNPHRLTGSSTRYFDGKQWRAGWEMEMEMVSIFGAHPTHQWRGLTTKGGK